MPGIPLLRTEAVSVETVCGRAACAGKTPGMLLKRMFLAVATALAMAAQAAEVTGDMALAAARAWAARNGSLSGEAGAPVSVKERRDGDGKLLWYEVAMSGGGCVVASADTEIEPIVAVIDRYDGEIPQDHPLEALLLSDMRGRLEMLSDDEAQDERMKTGASSASASGGGTAVVSASTADRKSVV